jgi:hypothetical protein
MIAIVGALSAISLRLSAGCMDNELIRRYKIARLILISS